MGGKRKASELSSNKSKKLEKKQDKTISKEKEKKKLEFSEDEEDDFEETPVQKIITNEFLGKLNEQKQNELVANSNEKPKRVKRALIADKQVKKAQLPFLEKKIENAAGLGKSPLQTKIKEHSTTSTQDISMDSKLEEEVEWEDVGVPEESNTMDISFGDDKEASNNDEELPKIKDGKLEETPPKVEPSKNLSILLDVKKEKEKRKGVTKADREAAAYFHKVHLLTLFMHLWNVNKWIEDENIQGAIFSLVPTFLHDSIEPEDINIVTMTMLIDWFRNFIKISSPNEKEQVDVDNDSMENSDGIERLHKVIDKRRASRTEAVMLFVSLCRSFGIPTRYVSILEPAGLKVSIPGTENKDEDSQKNKKKVQKNANAEPWLEFFYQSENRWTCVDVLNNELDKPDLFEKKRKDLSYVVAVESSYLKDVTRRYASRWSNTKTLRVEDEWIEKSLKCFGTGNRSSEWKKRDSEENKQFLLREENEDFPTSMEGFKRHPVYCLEQHLNPYQTLYPKEPVGNFKGKPIYKRSCIQELHTQDKWLQQGKIIKEHEQPAKKVKKKLLKGKENSEEKNSEENKIESNLFGEWQTEPYVPPPVKDGIVPKNSYGNIYLFTPQMLPKGCVRVDLPNAIRICKKIGIDFAPAMVGWDYRLGRPIPKIEGIVICEEHEDLLYDAWEANQNRLEEESAKKKSKRAIGNWEKLVRGLLLKAKLENKYLKKPEKDENSEKDLSNHRITL